MKIKITLWLIIAITLFSLSSCWVSFGGHGRPGHPPRVHHENHGDHD